MDQIDRSNEHGDHVVATPTKPFLWRIRAAYLVLVGALLSLIYVYFGDFLSFAGNSGTFWCPDRYGFPSQFDYIPRDSLERIGAGVTSWWSWTRPGLTCGFTDVVTKARVEVRPPVYRSIAAAAFAAAAVGALCFLAVLLTLRRRQR